jgi:hypothetical protein
VNFILEEPSGMFVNFLGLVIVAGISATFFSTSWFVCLGLELTIASFLVLQL